MQIELLAPAKNKDIGIAAIDCGADALYIAGPAFGAREAASNPLSEIEALVKYGHRYGVKVYMALNTILYDNELEEARRQIIKGYEMGCDAIIIQDLGILNMELPPIDLHASTQTNIRTPEQAKFLESLGFKRLILARELSLNQIKAIRDVTTCELESFIHGALCVSYSGQCYLSAHLTGRSANRGGCIQACRSNYDLVDGEGKLLIKNKPLLSLKDLSLEHYIPDLVKSGICSFKIEGRLKNKTYVANVTRYYREIIDRDGYLKSSFGTIDGGFSPKLDQTFNRGYTTYFISGERGKWNSKESSKSIGEKIGKITKIAPSNQKEITFFYEGSPLSNGDGLFIITPKGEKVGIRADKVDGRMVKTKCNKLITPHSTIYRNYNQKFEKKVESDLPKRYLNVYLSAITSPEEIKLDIKCENGISLKHSLTPTEGEFEMARDRDSAINSFKKQLEKRGSFFKFHLANIVEEGGFVPFLPLSAINSLRREVTALLEKRIGAERVKEDYCCTKVLKDRTIIPPAQTTKLNCANHLSNTLYQLVGLRPINAYEIDRDGQGEYSELMRTKYCLRYELGFCGKKIAEPWFICNNGKKFELKFDCKNCEMVVV